jgi:hypothetical protein
MKYAIIEDGKVANIAVADAPLESNWVPGEGAGIGDLYQDGQFIPSPPDTEAMARLARLQRNTLLADCDWTQLADAPVDDLAWAVYRQALRDVPNQPEFPLTIMWPVQPGA